MVNLFIAHPADEVYPLNVFRVRIVALGEPLLHSCSLLTPRGK